MKQLSLEALVIDCLNGFPKNRPLLKNI